MERDVQIQVIHGIPDGRADLDTGNRQAPHSPLTEREVFCRFLERQKRRLNLTAHFVFSVDEPAVETAASAALQMARGADSYADNSASSLPIRLIALGES